MRQHWIDTTKALCIIFVYYAHCCAYYGYGKESWLFAAINPFYVSMFFLVSGYLFVPKLMSTERTDLKKLAVSACFRIAIPSVIFSGLFILPKLIMKGGIIDLKYIMVNVGGGTNYWFTSSIFVAQIFLVCIKSTFPKLNLGILFVISFMASVLVFALNKECSNPFPWYWKSGLIGSFIMVCGGGVYLISDKSDSIQSQTSKRVTNIITFVLFLFCISLYIINLCFFSYHDVKCNIMLLDINVNGLAMMIISQYVILYVVRKNNEPTYLSYIGKNSLVYYFLSGVIPASLSTLLLKYNLENNSLILFFLWICSLLFATIVVSFINRYAYVLVDLRKIKNEKS